MQKCAKYFKWKYKILKITILGALHMTTEISTKIVIVDRMQVY